MLLTMALDSSYLDLEGHRAFYASQGTNHPDLFFERERFPQELFPGLV